MIDSKTSVTGYGAPEFICLQPASYMYIYVLAILIILRVYGYERLWFFAHLCHEAHKVS